MHSTQGRTSATIYQFPSGGRAGLGATDSARPGTPANVTRLMADDAVVDVGSWYHQAAIEDAGSDRKH